MDTKTKVSHKNSDLTSILVSHFGKSINLARIKFISLFICALCKVQVVCFEKLASGADREFVGEHWMDYLNFNHIEYHIRIRENFWVLNPRTGKEFKASWLFSDLKLNQTKFIHSIYYVNNQLCYLSASKVKNKEGKPELQIIVSFCKPKIAQKIYKERWQIETVFRALKTSGFNIEDTHLTDIDRIEKLFALVIIAFTWAYLVGIYLHDYVKPIRLLNNGRRAKSFFKYELTFVASMLLKSDIQSNIDIFQFLSCT